MPAPTRTLITDALRRSREANRAGALALDLPAPAEAARAIRRARVLAGYDALTDDQCDFILRTIEALRDGRIGP